MGKSLVNRSCRFKFGTGKTDQHSIDSFAEVLSTIQQTSSLNDKGRLLEQLIEEIKSNTPMMESTSYIFQKMKTRELKNSVTRTIDNVSQQVSVLSIKLIQSLLQDLNLIDQLIKNYSVYISQTQSNKQFNLKQELEQIPKTNTQELMRETDFLVNFHQESFILNDKEFQINDEIISTMIKLVETQLKNVNKVKELLQVEDSLQINRSVFLKSKTEIKIYIYLSLFLKNRNKSLPFQDFINKLRSIETLTGTKTQNVQLFVLFEIFSYKHSVNSFIFVMNQLTNNHSIGISYKKYTDKLLEMLHKQSFNSEITNFIEQTLNLKNSNTLTPGTYIQPMLGKNLNSFADLQKKLVNKVNQYDSICLETKYDGQRVQVHIYSTNNDKGRLMTSEDYKIVIFSRSGIDITAKYEHLIDDIKNFAVNKDIRGCVMDGEIVPFDFNCNKVLSFNVIQKMKNKKVENNQEKCKIFVFDLIYSDTVDSVNESPLKLRKEVLQQLFDQPQNPSLELIDSHYIHCSPSSVSELQAQIEETISNQFLAAKEIGQEGLMIKLNGAQDTYMPGSRTLWFKLKNMFGDQNESIDLVIIAGYYGAGKFADILSSYLLCAKSGDFLYPVVKVGTGFTEEERTELNHSLKQFVIDQPHDSVVFQKETFCSKQNLVWFKPAIVVEVSFDNFTNSSKYELPKQLQTKLIEELHQSKIYRTKPTYGVSMRFPVMKRLRDDKSLNEVTSIESIYENAKEIFFK
jgi:DNA ligase-1